MMKLRYQSKTKIWFEFDCADTREAWKKLATLQNVFEEERCGCCGGADLKFKYDQNQGFDFYELHCQNPQCRARLNFGQRKEDKELFPRRKDKDGNYLTHDGWVKFRSDEYANSQEDF